MGDDNTMKPGLSGVLTDGSKLCQLLHKHFGKDTIQKREGFQGG